MKVSDIIKKYLNPTTPSAYQSSFSPQPTILQDLERNSKVQSPILSFDTKTSTPSTASVNVLKGVAKGAKVVGNVALKQVIQPTLRTYGGVGAFVAKNYGLADTATLTPSGAVQKFLFGSEPFSAKTVGEEIPGLKGSKFAVPVGLALGLVDLIPGGQSKNVVLKSLQQADNVDDVTKILVKTLSFTDDAAKKLAPIIAKTDDAKRITSLLDDVVKQPGALITKKISQVAETIGKEAPSPTPVLESLQRGGKALQQSLPDHSLVSYPDTIPPSSINLKRFEEVGEEGLKKAEQLIDDMTTKVEAKIGKTLSHQEVKDYAKTSQDLLEKVVGRDSTLQWEAALKSTSDRLAYALKEGKLTQDALDDFMAIKTAGTDVARRLESFKITATPEKRTLASEILSEIYKVNKNADAILNAAKGVNLNDPREATLFYRNLVKPTVSEWLDLIRYNSMLSSPTTHAINIFSNLVNSAAVAPVEYTIRGGVDFVGSAVTGKPRQYFATEGASYISGYARNLGKAFQKVTDVMSGKQAVEHLDTRYIPLAPQGGLKGAAEKTLSVPMKLLEAMDQFFMTLSRGGEEAVISSRAGKGVVTSNADLVAEQAAKYRIFRQELNPENQGAILDAIDAVTGLLERARHHKNPLISNLSKYTVPFLRTPTNIFKQGIEYSPLGFSTVIGAKNKTEQITKAIMGTAVAFTASSMLASGRLTYGEPTNSKQKAEWRAAGRQPYSIKIGDTWYSYQKLPPVFAFPFALTAAIDDTLKYSKISDSKADLVLSSAAKILQFLSDQSYMKSIGHLVNAVKGEEYSLDNLASNYPTQLIPYRALSGWIARLVEESEKTIDAEGFIDKQMQLLMLQIPGVRNFTPDRPGPTGEPIERSFKERLINAFSPIRMTEENEQFANFLEAKEKQRAAESAFNESKPEAQKDSGGTLAEQLLQAEEDTLKAEAKRRVLETGKSEAVGNTVIYKDVDGTVKTKTIRNSADAPTEIKNIETKIRFDSEPAYREEIKSIYDQVQSFKTQGGSGWSNAEKAQAEQYLNTLNDEEYAAYQVYKEWNTSWKSQNTSKVKDLLYSDPEEAVLVVRSLPEEEAKRIIENLSEEEYKLYESGKGGFSPQETSTSGPQFSIANDVKEVVQQSGKTAVDKIAGYVAKLYRKLGNRKFKQNVKLMLAETYPMTDEAMARIDDIEIHNVRPVSTPIGEIPVNEHATPGVGGFFEPSTAMSGTTDKIVDTFARAFYELGADNTSMALLEVLDPEELKIVRATPDILSHEIIHALVDENLNPAAVNQAWYRLLQGEAGPAAQLHAQKIDEHIDKNYKNASARSYAHERLAYFGADRGTYGLAGIPRFMRPFYEGIFRESSNEPDARTPAIQEYEDRISGLRSRTAALPEPVKTTTGSIGRDILQELASRSF